jgi:peptidoglycan L-alanyl-D-glutamate endopeptidase CwlK
MNELSKKKLATCHPDLQTLFNAVDEFYSTLIIEGHRGEAAQNKAFKEGKSKLEWPTGKHNKAPSLALDAAPAPLDWDDTYRFIYYAGIVAEFARQLGIKVRWGGDWNRNGKIKEEQFKDLVHFELIVGE